MKIRYLLCFLVPTFVWGCTESPAPLSAPIFDDVSDVVEDVFVPPPTVDILLRVGHFSLSGHFIEKPNEVPVSSDGSWGYVQVAAKLDVPEAFDPDFLRVTFTSDRVEWLATDTLGNTYVFLDEQECLETGLMCNDIVPAASESGYFETGGPFDERLAIANVHCSPTALPYDLTVTAFFIDVSYPLAEIVSE